MSVFLNEQYGYEFREKAVKLYRNMSGLTERFVILARVFYNGCRLVVLCLSEIFRQALCF